MIKLKRADYDGIYHGFCLKEGFWYGIDTETNQFIATSGWECNGAVALYFLVDGRWKMSWIDIEETEFDIEVPDIQTDGKLPLSEWLEKEQGITWNDWDNGCCEQMQEEYNSYYYDGLPKFVQKYL